MRRAGGSAVRAWVVGHDGFRVGAMLVAVGIVVSLYAYVRVPSPYGGPIPMWFLTPPTLAMFAALAVQNEIPEVGWSTGRLRRARLGWALAMVMLTGVAAAVVGGSAGQHRLAELTMALTGLTFGLAVLVGRGSVALGAGCLVVIVVSTRALYHLTPAGVWERLSGPGQLTLGAACAGCVVAYAHIGPRISRAALTG